MEKTKIGIGVGFLAAAIGFLGSINTLVAFLLVFYVLMCEENDWLKKTAVKVATIIICFELVLMGIGIISDIFRIIDNTIGWIGIKFALPFDLDDSLFYGVLIIKNLVLAWVGFNALTLGTVKLPVVDKLVNKYM